MLYGVNLTGHEHVQWSFNTANVLRFTFLGGENRRSKPHWDALSNVKLIHHKPLICVNRDLQVIMALASYLNAWAPDDKLENVFLLYPTRYLP